MWRSSSNRRPSSFFKERRQRRLAMVLRTRHQRPGLQLSNAFPQASARRVRPAEAPDVPAVSSERMAILLLQQHGTGIHSFIHQHRGDAGFGFAIDDGPLDRAGSAIFRQERAVHIDAARGRKRRIAGGRMRPNAATAMRSGFQCRKAVQKLRRPSFLVGCNIGILLALCDDFHR